MWEVTAALARRRGQPGLSVAQAAVALRQFRRDFGQDYRVVEITIALLQRASELADAHALWGYDAVQLAVALDVRCREPRRWCSSQRMPNSTRRQQPRGCWGGRFEYASVKPRTVVAEMVGPFCSISTNPPPLAVSTQRLCRFRAKHRTVPR